MVEREHGRYGGGVGETGETMTKEEKFEAVVALLDGIAAKDVREWADVEIEDYLERRCEKAGTHEFTDDQCGRPEHRFCIVCYARPKTEDSAREAKVDEAAASKAAVPSESLGSGSKSFGQAVREWFN